jgi:hypothetical protein
MSEDADSAAGHSLSDADEDVDDVTDTLSGDDSAGSNGGNDDDGDDGGGQPQQGYVRYGVAERAAPAAAAAAGLDRLMEGAEQAFMQAINRWVINHSDTKVNLAL